MEGGELGSGKEVMLACQTSNLYTFVLYTSLLIYIHSSRHSFTQTDVLEPRMWWCLFSINFILQPLEWLNPLVSVSCNGKFVPAIGISSFTLADFAQVTTKVMFIYIVDDCWCILYSWDRLWAWGLFGLDCIIRILISVESVGFNAIINQKLFVSSPWRVSQEDCWLKKITYISIYS